MDLPPVGFSGKEQKYPTHLNIACTKLLIVARRSEMLWTGNRRDQQTLQSNIETRSHWFN